MWRRLRSQYLPYQLRVRRHNRGHKTTTTLVQSSSTSSPVSTSVSSSTTQKTSSRVTVSSSVVASSSSQTFSSVSISSSSNNSTNSSPSITIIPSDASYGDFSLLYLGVQLLSFLCTCYRFCDNQKKEKSPIEKSEKSRRRLIYCKVLSQFSMGNDGH